MAVRTGLEPATPCVTGMYSNQLNYRTFSGSATGISTELRCKDSYLFFSCNNFERFFRTSLQILRFFQRKFAPSKFPIHNFYTPFSAIQGANSVQREYSLFAIGQLFHTIGRYIEGILDSYRSHFGDNEFRLQSKNHSLFEYIP